MVADSEFYCDNSGLGYTVVSKHSIKDGIYREHDAFHICRLDSFNHFFETVRYTVLFFKDMIIKNDIRDFFDRCAKTENSEYIKNNNPLLRKYT